MSLGPVTKNFITVTHHESKRKGKFHSGNWNTVKKKSKKPPFFSSPNQVSIVLEWQKSL